MWKLTTMSLLFVAVLIMSMIGGLPAQLVTLNSEKYRQDLSLRFEEPMDRCDGLKAEKYETIALVKQGLAVIGDIGGADLLYITIEDNRISSIAENAFRYAPNLFCLNIAWNSALSIFKEFLPAFRHNTVVKINLAYATAKDNNGKYRNRNYKISIKDVEGSKNTLPRLTHLDISGNNLLDLPMYLNYSFPSLTHLYLSNNQLNSSFLDRVPNTVKYLYLERNSMDINVTYLSKNITGLFLSDNNIINPEGFKEFKKIKTLSIRNCTKSISIINNLVKRKIVNLDMASNGLDTIPDMTFEGFTSLKHLSLDQNRLISLSFLRPLQSLINLSVAYNRLFTIADDYFDRHVDLKTLNLRKNEIIAMNREAFGNNHVLEKLDLAGNKLKLFENMWTEFLPNLEYLNLQSNLFQSIEDIHIRNNTNLLDLFIANNQFASFHISNFKHLPRNIRIHTSSIDNCTYI